MVVALIAVSLIAVLLLAALIFVISRPSPTSLRERLLERDVRRLQAELSDSHDKLMYAVEKPWNVAPIDLDPPARDEPDEDDEPTVLSHDELDDLVYLPDMPDAYAGAM